MCQCHPLICFQSAHSKMCCCSYTYLKAQRRRTHIHTCMFIYGCIYMCIYIYMFMYIYISWSVSRKEKAQGQYSISCSNKYANLNCNRQDCLILRSAVLGKAICAHTLLKHNIFCWEEAMALDCDLSLFHSVRELPAFFFVQSMQEYFQWITSYWWMKCKKGTNLINVDKSAFEWTNIIVRFSQQSHNFYIIKSTIIYPFITMWFKVNTFWKNVYVVTILKC